MSRNIKKNCRTGDEGVILGTILAKPRSIYILASVDSTHERRIIQGVARYGNLQSPPWMVRWGRMLEVGLIEKEGIDGVVTFALGADQKDACCRLKMPVVNVSSRNTFWTGSSVLPDNHAIGEIAARHFKERLFKKFAFVGLRNEEYSHGRFEGFARAVAPLPCATCWMDLVCENADTQNAHLSEFLRSLPYGTAIMTANDYFARRVCVFAAQMERAVPEDLAVLGVDADEMISLSSVVKLSSVDPHSEKIGMEAARLLDQMMSGKRKRATLKIPPRGIVVNRSTDHLATDDADIARTIQFIKRNACQGIGVEEVARQAGLGRRTLERRFKAVVGRGIDEEIRRARLERAVDLINNSTLTISEIAERTGFANLFYFSTVFKKHYGMSPKQYRSRN